MLLRKLCINAWHVFTFSSGHSGIRLRSEGPGAAQTETLWEKEKPGSLPHPGNADSTLFFNISLRHYQRSHLASSLLRSANVASPAASLIPSHQGRRSERKSCSLLFFQLLFFPFSLLSLHVCGLLSDRTLKRQWNFVHFWLQAITEKVLSY